MMQHYLVFLSLILIAPFSYQSATTGGAIDLDDLSFYKITSKFDASLVKFDVAFPYGDKHDAFINLAREAKDVDELLIAAVGVKDYGERDNEALAEKYGATKDNFPVVKLFIKGQEKPITFDQSKGFTIDELRRFVRQHTGLYLSLPGCVSTLDKLAIEFMKSKDDRENIFKKTETALKKLPVKDIPSGKIYKTIMSKVLEKGDEFIQTEHERVKKVLSGKLSEEKKKEIGIRLNILQTFQLHDKQPKVKDDL